MIDDALIRQAEEVLVGCREHGLMVATAESCTGGLIAAALTEIAGSSDVFERAFVTYSNEAKSDLLGVPAELIAREGAVSEAVARAMAQGALDRGAADLVVAVTGIAGPGGGSADRPVGRVHIAAARGKRVLHEQCDFGDQGRSQVRLLSAKRALDLAASLI
jgi:nicotinamide-nucleotide amidase